MGLLRRDKKRQSSRERSQLRSHLQELEELREDRLRDLGDRALEMHRGEGPDRARLWGQAAEIAAIEDEAKLVRKGLDEGLTLAQLEEISRG